MDHGSCRTAARFAALTDQTSVSTMIDFGLSMKHLNDPWSAIVVCTLASYTDYFSIVISYALVWKDTFSTMTLVWYDSVIGLQYRYY
jgi:hypothetical protein